MVTSCFKCIGLVDFKIEFPKQNIKSRFKKWNHQWTFGGYAWGVFTIIHSITCYTDTKEGSNQLRIKDQDF